MLEWLRSTVLRALKVPAEPAAQQGAVRVFRAAPGYYRYRLAGWLLKQAGALVGILFGFAFVRTLPGWSPPAVLWWLGVGEMIATAAFVAQLPFSFALLRLDYEMRWYIVGQRSLRVREGMINVREQTMTYANVQNISIHQGPLQRVFGIADLEVRTAGGGGEHAHTSGEGPGPNRMHVGTFRGVDDAEAIRDTIREQVRRHRDAGLGDPDDAPAPAALPALPAGAPAVLAAREVLDAVRSLRGALGA
ncbi:MAG TPA: PH domain-containing protein [Longimicrobiaceae bacterium]|nr:PH domain-containing protein [Longimicrobiaceae bacterium]